MIQMLESNEGSDDPFFGYLAYTAPHDPLHVENEALIEKYEELYLSDYNFEELRDLRIKRMEDLGLIDENIDTRWLESSPAWEDLDNVQGPAARLGDRCCVRQRVLPECSSWSRILLASTDRAGSVGDDGGRFVQSR